MRRWYVYVITLEIGYITA